MKRLSLIFAPALLLLIASCGAPGDGVSQAESAAAAPDKVENGDSFTPFPTPTDAELPTPTPTESVRSTPSSTAEATVTLEPPEPTPTPTPTSTPSPTPTESVRPTPSPTSEATVTLEPPEPTPTPTSTPSPTPTATPTQGTPQPTATATPTPLLTATATATATVTPTRTPIPSAVFVRSHTSYLQNAQFVVVGELVNGGAFDVFGVIVHGRFFDSAGLLIATAHAPAAIAKIEVERPAPFRIIADVDPAAVKRYELSVSSEETSIVEYRELEVSDIAMVERDGGLAVVGELFNGHEMALSSVVVAVAFYEEDGEVVDVAETVLSEERISPGAVHPFELLVPDAGRAYARLRVLAQGQVSLF